MEVNGKQDEPRFLIITIKDTISYIKYDVTSKTFKICTHNSTKIFYHHSNYFFLTSNLLGFCGNLLPELDEVHILDIEKNTIIQKPQMPILSPCAGVQKFNDRFYFFGGLLLNGLRLKNCFYYNDLNLENSTPISDLPECSHNISCYKNQDLIVLAGYTLSYIYTYHPELDRYGVIRIYKRQGYHKVLLFHENKIYILSTNELLIKEEAQEEWYKYNLNFENVHLITPLVMHQQYYYFADQYRNIQRFNTLTNQIENVELLDQDIIK